MKLQMVLLMCVAAMAVDAAPPECEGDYIYYQGACYRFSRPAIDMDRDELTYWEAREQCESEGSWLVDLYSRAEANWVRARYNSQSRTRYFWIGLNDLDDDNVWNWLDGTNATAFTDWPGSGSQPDGCCEPFPIKCVGVISTFSFGGWFDVSCNSTHYVFNFICKQRDEACAPDPCQHGGTCTPVGASNSYRCDCPDGYNGDDCENDLCVTNMCQNGGTCVRRTGDTECRCPPGFTGVLCETNMCEADPCENGATCVPIPGDYSCTCPPGFTGRNCQDDACVPSPCVRGTCERMQGPPGYRCVCPPGYGGPNCGRDFCNPNPCNNGGSCDRIAGLPGYSCRCPPGFSGPNCDDGGDPCSPNHCRNGGTCRDTSPGSYTCTCPPGFTGPNCEDDLCDPNPCNAVNGGRCRRRSRGRGYRCICPRGYSGPHCMVPDCDRNPCRNGGTCEEVLAVPDYWCVCPPGYTGRNCEDVSCDRNPCYNGGTCRILNDRIDCECPPDYSGDYCQYCALGVGAFYRYKNKNARGGRNQGRVGRWTANKCAESCQKGYFTNNAQRGDVCYAFAFDRRRNACYLFSHRPGDPVPPLRGARYSRTYDLYLRTCYDSSPIRDRDRSTSTSTSTSSERHGSRSRSRGSYSKRSRDNSNSSKKDSKSDKGSKSY